MMAPFPLVDHLAKHMVAIEAKGVPIQWVSAVSSDLLTQVLGLPIMVPESRMLMALLGRRLSLFLVDGRVSTAVRLAWGPLPMSLGKGIVHTQPPAEFTARAKQILATMPRGADRDAA